MQLKVEREKKLKKMKRKHRNYIFPHPHSFSFSFSILLLESLKIFFKSLMAPFDGSFEFVVNCSFKSHFYSPLKRKKIFFFYKFSLQFQFQWTFIFSCHFFFFVKICRKLFKKKIWKNMSHNRRNSYLQSLEGIKTFTKVENC